MSSANSSVSVAMSPALNAAYPAVVDRLAADPELASDFGDTPAGICELQATMAELGWIPLWHVEGSAPEDSRKPVNETRARPDVSSKAAEVHTSVSDALVRQMVEDPERPDLRGWSRNPGPRPSHVAFPAAISPLACDVHGPRRATGAPSGASGVEAKPISVTGNECPGNRRGASGPHPQAAEDRSGKVPMRGRTGPGRMTCVPKMTQFTPTFDQGQSGGTAPRAVTARGSSAGSERRAPPRRR
jgi:hypothetical protein